MSNTKKLLLSCDECCYVINGKYYLSDLGALFVNRYLRVFDSITLALRTMYVPSERDLNFHINAIQDNRISIIEAPNFQGPVQFLKNIPKLYSTLSKGIKDIDLAILRLPSAIAFVVFEILKGKKIPYATEIVFDCFDAIKGSRSFSEKIIWYILHKLQIQACNQARGISYVTEYYLQKHYPPKGKRTITSSYSTIELQPDFFYKARTAPSSKEFLIIHISNQVQYNGRKGHNELIRLLSELNKEKKRARILFVGENYMNGQNLLEKYAQELGVYDDICFSGYVSQKELRNLLLKADIAILPTRVEGLPRVVIEAMALGLPCITSPVSGNPELIDEEMLVDYNDIEGMKKACINVIENKDIYELQSKTNFENSLKYSSTVLNARRDAFYKKLKQSLKSD